MSRTLTPQHIIHDKMTKKEELYKILEMNQDIRKYHHNALWEIQKHFTWWISIILSAIIFIQISKLDIFLKIFIITVSSLFGIYLSYIGFTAVRKEGRYFREAIEKVNRTYAALGMHKPLGSKYGSLKLMPQYPLSKNFEKAKNNANKNLEDLLLLSREKKGVRDYFQLVFIASGMLFYLFYINAWVPIWFELFIQAKLKIIIYSVYWLLIHL